MRRRNYCARPSMSVCYLTHDRHAQSGTAAGPGSVTASKALEGMFNELRRETRRFVGYIEADACSHSLGTEHDLALPVPQRVVDQIPKRLAEAEGIGTNQ